MMRLRTKERKCTQVSEQELVSCSTQNHGCQGGIMDNAFAYIQQDGIVTEASYPYTSGGGNTGTCDQSKVSQATTFLKSQRGSVLLWAAPPRAAPQHPSWA